MLQLRRVVDLNDFVRVGRGTAGRLRQLCTAGPGSAAPMAVKVAKGARVVVVIWSVGEKAITQIACEVVHVVGNADPRAGAATLCTSRRGHPEPDGWVFRFWSEGTC